MNARSGTDDVRITMEPGRQWSYSNGGYTLLQLAIEEVTGEPFARYMQREVLDPLGMTHSSFTWQEDLRAQPRRATTSQDEQSRAPPSPSRPRAGSRRPPTTSPSSWPPA